MWDILKSEYVIEKIGFLIKIDINFHTNGYKCSYKKNFLTPKRLWVSHFPPFAITHLIWFTTLLLETKESDT